MTTTTTIELTQQQLSQLGPLFMKLSEYNKKNPRKPGSIIAQVWYTGKAQAAFLTYEQSRLVSEAIDPNYEDSIGTGPRS